MKKCLLKGKGLYLGGAFLSKHLLSTPSLFCLLNFGVLKWKTLREKQYFYEHALHVARM